MSDGTFSPFEIAEIAMARGLSLVALTDHDTVAGVPEAVEAGRAAGIKVLPGIEFNTDFQGELHILGLGIDIKNKTLLRAIEKYAACRGLRNDEILHRLSACGMDVTPYFHASKGETTRLHIANAIVAGGFAMSRHEAFEKYLMPGCNAYVRSERIGQREAIELIHQAGGLAILAHPFKTRANVHTLTQSLCAYGLDGIEVYYPKTSEGDKAVALSIARQYGLLVTAGSDFHGDNRKYVSIGCSYEPSEELEATYRKIIGKYFVD